MITFPEYTRKFSPVFPFLQEGTQMYKGKSLEYYPTSKKAFSIAKIYNTKVEKTINAGFLFIDVQEICQKYKCESLENELNCDKDDLLLSSYIHSIDNTSEIKTYILDFGENIVLIKAKDVQFIEEDIYFA
ncbi:hypothetical protein [Chryseobacterium viscerum]|uniref:Uncharacterized protein n=1 Tax=Chryseobacterium viscerum TaxID=1037377 RepID=A0A316WRZ7_9FLAO|nr:hypothetical protein [Chryseobacterium viscerum]PWN64201.1 hypothetical protein C1634_006290 [Chryseobacterium viscerum]